MTSKSKQFVKQFLKKGCSTMINRYQLPKPFNYTSGDGIFRSDSSLGKEYKFFRFSRTLDYTKKSNCWILSKKDKRLIKNEHSKLTFPTDGSGKTVRFIKFYGKTKKKTTRTDPSEQIRLEICKRPCAHCGTRKDIQCDHKNDLYNDPEVSNPNTQTINHFQALCRHCNCVKRQVKKKMIKTNKRYSATHLGYNIDFISGDETLDKNDPNWYIGTYWGDVLYFKQHLTTKSDND